MTHDTIALLLWSALGLSVMLSVVGVGVQRPALLFVAAVISFCFAVAALFSIGIFVLIGAIVPLALGMAVLQSQRSMHVR